MERRAKADICPHRFYVGRCLAESPLFEHATSPAWLGIGNLKGRIAVRFDIRPDGKVGRAFSAAGTTFPDQEVVSCVLEASKGIEFPPPYGPVSYSFMLMLRTD